MRSVGRASPYEMMCLWCQGAVQTDYISDLKHSFQVRTTAFGVESHHHHAYGFCSSCQPCACTRHSKCHVQARIQIAAKKCCCLLRSSDTSAFATLNSSRYQCLCNSTFKQILKALHCCRPKTTAGYCSQLERMVHVCQRMLSKRAGRLTNGSHANDPKCLAMQLHAKGVPNAALFECLLQAKSRNMSAHSAACVNDTLQTLLGHPGCRLLSA